METKKQSTFFGTIFNKDVVIRITRIAKLFSWLIIIFYLMQWSLQTWVLISQIIKGFWTGMGFTDILQNLFWLIEQPLRGLVYFVVLQGVAQVLLMILDIENNTRVSKNDF